MIESDKPQFVAVLAGLASVKPGAPTLTPEALDLWWGALKSWPLEEFRAAAEHLSTAVEFMPNPYHFAQLRKASEQTAGEAFERARQIVRRLHPREFIGHKSGDARLDAAIRACGGYEALANCTSENIGFFENRFREHFESISDAESVRGALPQITGGPRLNGPVDIADVLRGIA